jgi:hypothetical protein
MLPSVALPVGMLAALVVTAFGAHLGLPGEAGRINPAAVMHIDASWSAGTSLTPSPVIATTPWCIGSPLVQARCRLVGGETTHLVCVQCCGEFGERSVTPVL